MQKLLKMKTLLFHAKFKNQDVSNTTVHISQNITDISLGAAKCCKANFKTNPLHLETKQDEPYLYTFKYLNYKGDYQANSNACPFWKH